MWIRSQDRKFLVDAKAIGADGIGIRACIGGDRANSGPLGEYESEERAIEVLDDIQKDLQNTLMADSSQYIVVYEMPEK